jgi:hypothetical protein
MTFHSIGNVIIPTDFHSIFFPRGRRKTTNQKNLVYIFVKFSHEIMESAMPKIWMTRGTWFYSTVATKDNVSCGVMMSALKKGAGQALVSGARKCD